MKTVIYYFSGTGNNLAVAKDIARNLGDTTILPIRFLSKTTTIPSEYDVVGFCIPSYFSHIPPYVKSCMEHLTYTETQKIFTIVVCGGNRGAAIKDLRTMIQARGKTPTWEYMITMPGNYILSYNAFPKIYQKLTHYMSHRKVHRITKAIKKGKPKTLKKDGLFYRSKREAYLQESIAEFGKKGTEFSVSDDCKACGLCAKICPVQNISVSNGKIVFGGHCNQCMACIQWCPNHAIDWNNQAANRRRYHHPDIKVSDLFVQ